MTSGQLLSECTSQAGRGSHGTEKEGPGKGTEVGRGCWRNRGTKGLFGGAEEKLLFWRFFQTISFTRKETTADHFKNLG